jgi:UDP-N-acetylglucosamine transferase subunit ALG13
MTNTGVSDPPLILVTVGTDVFPFPRLMEWMNRWLDGSERRRARVVVQHGSSTPPSGAEAHSFINPSDMRALMDEASVIVCHGAGPSVLEALEHRSVPIVVPRMRDLGEAVDDHQVSFTNRMETHGLVRRADSAERLGVMLDQALADPSSLQLLEAVTNGSDAGHRFASHVRSIVPSSVVSRNRLPRVVYIGGVGRSGSTVLERLLGEVPGLCAVGELVHLWNRGLLENQSCGCGSPFLQCPFWDEVGQAAFGGWDRVDGRGVADLKAAVDRHRNLLFMIQPRLDPAFTTRQQRMADVLIALYQAIASVSGEIVVDSSKSSSYLVLLSRIRSIDLRLVHLIRDSRGVAYSTTKRVRRPEVRDADEYMPTQSPTRAALDYVAYNTLLDLAGSTGIPSMRLRYERLVSDPKRQVGRILRFAGIGDTTGKMDFIAEGSARLGPIHSVSGNPMRFISGDVQIRLDEEWRTGLAGRHRAAVSLITSPLLGRYGYDILR